MAKIVELKYPIVVDGKPVNELRFGRMKAKHIKLLPKEFYENEGKGINPSMVIILVAALCNIPESAADDIDIDDLANVGEALSTFLEKSLQTGKS